MLVGAILFTANIFLLGMGWARRKDSGEDDDDSYVPLCS